MRLESDHALHLHCFGQQEEKAEEIAIVGLFPFGTGKHLANIAECLLHIADRVSEQQGRYGSTADRNHFMRHRFENDFEMATGNDVAAEDHHEQKHNRDDLKHMSSALAWTLGRHTAAGRRVLSEPCHY